MFREEKMKYKLLKDTPTVKAGTIGEAYPASSNEYAFKAIANMGDYYVHFKKHAVENNPDWFEPVIERWRAESNRYYFIVSHSLEPNMIMDTLLPEHDFQFNTGNYFKQMKQAEEASRRIKKVLMDYHKEIGE